AIERKFIEDNLRKLEVKEFLLQELERAGCGEIDIQRTPQGTRVIVNAQRPGLVIGRKGATIKKLTTVINRRYKIDNPQIEVNELQIPELNAKVMSNNIASSLERGIHFRRAAYMALRRIMEAGARGVQIEISGKLTGDRSKSVKFTDGYLKHCGDPALMYVRRGVSQASPKPGVLGVKVMIMPPGVVLPDDIEIHEVEGGKEKTEELGKIVEGKEAPKAKKPKPDKVKRKKARKKKEKKPAEELGKIVEGKEAPKAKKKKVEKKEKPASKKEKIKKPKRKKKSGDTEK
ncbi:MAG: 30S ribosomal protein S3, partial [Candidatus Hydrothermarchaeota archaeon]|nr:30S ribosomal protein S3 [Candidatus Hydrothermarchaeota archaeon]